jgi:hypothetical protein
MDQFKWRKRRKSRWGIIVLIVGLAFCWDILPGKYFLLHSENESGHNEEPD